MSLDQWKTSIDYEIALRTLGLSRQPFMRAIDEEEKKPAPSQAFISYCKSRLAAIDDLQDDLLPTDKDTIERILAKGDPTFNIL